MSRVVITGGPSAGKTTLADHLGLPVRHTDELVDVLEWSAASEEVSRWMDAPGPWVIEGVTAVRALRKWLERHREGAPCDVLLVLLTPAAALDNNRQAGMYKSVETVLSEIRMELRRRGVLVYRVDALGRRASRSS